MTIHDALTIVKQTSDSGEESLRRLEENLEMARQMLGPTVDENLKQSRVALEATRVVIAWVEERLEPAK